MAGSHSGAAKRAASYRAASCRSRGFFLGPKTKSLTYPKIQSEPVRTRCIVNRNNRHPRYGNQIEAAVRRVHNAGGAGGAIPSGCARVVYGVSVDILPGGDVKRRAGTGDHKWTDAESVSQADGTTEKNAVSNVECGAAIILREVEGIRRNVGSAGGVAVRIIQGVVSEERKFRTHSNAAIHNKLILL